MDDRNGTSGSPGTALNPAGSQGTILVAEDGAPLRQFLVRALAEAGYDVLAAGDGAEALRVAGCYQGAIHVLVTDMDMPRLDGAGLAASIRRFHPAIGVVIMSGGLGRGTPAPVAGARLLDKPFTVRALFEAVRDAPRWADGSGANGPANGKPAPPAAPPR